MKKARCKMLLVIMDILTLDVNTDLAVPVDFLQICTVAYRYNQGYE